MTQLLSPTPWYLSEIMESQLGGIKYLIRSEDRNQFPTWIAELANHGEDNGKANGELIVRAVNSYAKAIDGELARELAIASIDSLIGRKGFDEWWSEVREFQPVILSSIEIHLQRIIDARKHS